MLNYIKHVHDKKQDPTASICTHRRDGLSELISVTQFYTAATSVTEVLHQFTTEIISQTSQTEISEIEPMEKSIVQVQCVFSGFILVFLFFEFTFCIAITTAMSKQLYMRATVRHCFSTQGKSRIRQFTGLQKGQRTTRQNWTHAKLQKTNIQNVCYPLVTNESHYRRK